MGCPNCNRESAVTLSICPSCGIMLNDSVREELASRISTRKADITEPPIAPVEKKEEKKIAPLPVEELKPKTKLKGKSTVPKSVNQIKLNPSPKNVSTKPTKTAEIVASNTNRTLVEFQAPKNEIPEWRLQLKNVVQQRQGKPVGASSSGRASSIPATVGAYSSASAGVMSAGIAGAVPASADNDRIANALKRIERSRNKYLVEEPILKAVPATSPPVESPNKKDFPFSIAETSQGVAVAKAEPVARAEVQTRPKLVPENRKGAVDLYDTSELEPEFVEAKVSSSFKKQEVIRESNPTDVIRPNEEVRSQEIEEANPVAPEQDTTDEEVYDDFAPLSLRFNSGLFDVIVGCFGSMILLAPFMLLGGSWFTVAGFFGFLATFTLVMFIYLTTTIGLFGRSLGMRLFSLEMIDIGGEEYPTFHQAAVSSSIFLLSLLFCGAGFIASFFDEENRAVHDLVSGTIVVKEF